MHSTISLNTVSKQPRNDGLWLIDIGTKQAKLLISIFDLSQQLYRGAFSWSTDPVTRLPYNTTTGELYYRRSLLSHVEQWDSFQQACRTQSAW